MKSKTFFHGTVASILAMGASMSAIAGLFGFGGTSWKEEVLLHDGSRVVVERSQSYGGRHEIGQSPPVKEHTIAFELPGTSKTIKWTSEFSKEIGRTNFNLLALHVLNGVPYLVVEPNLCLSYNKWGRPNPPYLIFKYDGTEWHRISLEELPDEFKTINLIVNNGREEDIEKAAEKFGYVPAAGVQEINKSLKQPEYRNILREPLLQKQVDRSCGEMIYDGRGGWVGVGWFRNQPTYAACLSYCSRNQIDSNHCPCGRYFEREK